MCVLKFMLMLIMTLFMMFSLITFLEGLFKHDSQETSFLVTACRWNHKRRGFINFLLLLPLIPYYLGKLGRKIFILVVYKEAK